jgi:hypothetical protein
MNKRGLVFLFLIIAGLYWNNISACGDKFLVAGRGILYERAYPAKHAASILIYTNQAEAGKNLANFLKKSGHKIQTAADQKSLFTNLETTKYDLVLLTLSDVAVLETRVTSSRSKPIVLPVIYNPKGTEPDTDKKENSCLLKYGGKNKNVIATIDQVMEEKKNGKAIACKL